MSTESVPEKFDNFHTLNQLSDREDFIEYYQLHSTATCLLHDISHVPYTFNLLTC